MFENLFNNNLVLWIIVAVVVVILVINKTKKESFTADVNDEGIKSEKLMCSESCCSNDTYVPHLKMGAPEGYTTSNQGCLIGDKKGCVCLTEAQKKNLTLRGGNNSKCCDGK